MKLNLPIYFMTLVNLYYKISYEKSTILVNSIKSSSYWFLCTFNLFSTHFVF